MAMGDVFFFESRLAGWRRLKSGQWHEIGKFEGQIWCTGILDDGDKFVKGRSSLGC